ncbi:hypothetical protein GCM10010252_03550 [Streptomyces aureoverticillatus]|nr:hypothetical protein GCM10010252_03550 [Streptomyces aureoverticillatus]
MSARSRASSSSAGKGPSVKASAAKASASADKAGAGKSAKPARAGAASGGSGRGASGAAAGRGGAAAPARGAAGSGAAAAPGSFLAQPLNVARLAAYAGLFVLGAVVGIAGALAQQGWFPGGLLLALVGSAGAFYGGSRATGTRGGAVAPAAGWLAAVMLLTATRPEGDFVFGAGVGSYAFLLGGMGVAVMCATLGQSPQPGSSDARLGK